MNKFIEKKTLLLHLYDIFDDYVKSYFEVACIKGCASCCTQNVTLTTLEAFLILEDLRQTGKPHALSRLEMSSPALFRPRYTINDLALACFNRQEPPGEEPGPELGSCPLLENDLCPVYESRPFACRSFLSLRPCQPAGQADVPSRLISVITACQQVIEHLDMGGSFGNLTDLLFLLAHEDNSARYALDEALSVLDLPGTKPLPGFLIPPHDASFVQPFLARLFDSDLGGVSFYTRLNNLRHLPAGLNSGFHSAGNK